MEKYNADIKDDPKVALIHISLDRENEPAEKWAAAEKLPWLTVLPSDTEDNPLLDYRTWKGVPHYALIDADGNRIAAGTLGILNKLKDLTDH